MVHRKEKEGGDVGASLTDDDATRRRFGATAAVPPVFRGSHFIGDSPH